MRHVTYRIRLGMLVLGTLLAGGIAPSNAQNDPNLARVSSAPIPQRGVIVPGEHPLTAEMQDRLVLMFEWILDAQTTQEQRQQLKDWMVSIWRSNSLTDMQNAMTMVNVQRILENKPEAERESIRQQLSAKLLAAVRQNPASPSNRWMLEIYESAHQPLAQGNPPLTRQMIDSWCEVLCFMRAKILGDESVQASQAMKDAAARSVAKEYSGYSAAWQKHLAGMPLLWAEIRAQWPKMSAEERESYRKQWREYLKATFPEMLAARPTPKTQPAPQYGIRPGETAAQAMARIQHSHEVYMMLSNGMMMNHVANMNAISNIGNSGWRYEFRYTP